jgi:UDP-N-acetylmuramoyl-tripeptide--D-alanyl-D-alanine ligase
LESLTAGAAARLTGGVLYGEAAAAWTGCAIDSRALTPGMLFVALPGERTDGRRFIGAAFAAGAAAVLCGPTPQRPPAGRALIAAADPLAAMQELARARRALLQARVVAVTGSSGKTTTKDLTAAVLAVRWRTHKSEGNHNNEIGLPLTVLNAPAGTEMLALEMGMRGPGQIAALCRVCPPDAGVLTNIGAAHMEMLGSQENIARAKWELMDNLTPDGLAVLNAEDEWCAALGNRRSGAKVYYGTAGRYARPAVRAVSWRPALGAGLSTLLRVTAEEGGRREEAEVTLPLAGEHNVLDALAALTAGRRYGVSLAAGAAALATARISAGRLETFAGEGGSTIIDDAYNANPLSMLASLRVLAERGGRQTIAVLGDMYELGAAEAEQHRRVGAAAAALGLGRLVGTGELGAQISAGALAAGMAPAAVSSCRDTSAALAGVRRILKEELPGAWVLVKGSRKMGMEEISQGLAKNM